MTNKFKDLIGDSGFWYLIIVLTLVGLVILTGYGFYKGWY